MMEKANSRKGIAYTLAMCAVLTALAMIFSYVEMLIPFNFGIPGIKLGLPNLVILIALYKLDMKSALSINIVRIVLSGLLFSGISGMLYSLAGGLFSFAVMYIMIKTGIFSPVGVSMAGGVAHNVAQITVAALITETVKIYLYLPVLMISGMITGVLLGTVAAMIMEKTDKSVKVN